MWNVESCSCSGSRPFLISGTSSLTRKASSSILWRAVFLGTIVWHASRISTSISWVSILSSTACLIGKGASKPKAAMCSARNMRSGLPFIVLSYISWMLSWLISFSTGTGVTGILDLSRQRNRIISFWSRGTWYLSAKIQSRQYAIGSILKWSNGRLGMMFWP